MCGKKCSFTNGNAACGGGNCLLTSCTTPYADCDHSSGNGCEVNTNTDSHNCGGCGKMCDLGETCNSGTCTTAVSGNLLGYWPMEDAANSTLAMDWSGNNLWGRVVGAVKFMPGSGKQGSGAASFTGGYIDVTFPNNARMNGTGVYIPQGNITFTMWIQTSATGMDVQGISSVWGNTWGGGYDRIIGNGNDTGPLWYNSWQEENFQGTHAVNDGSWHHVAYVLDETNGLMAYVDGASDGSDANPTTNCGVGCSGFDWASEYFIGTGNGGRFNAGAFSGLIDDVRIYSVPLTAAQVTALYNATK
jgi:hypothetical protein